VVSKVLLELLDRMFNERFWNKKRWQYKKRLKRKNVTGIKNLFTSLKCIKNFAWSTIIWWTTTQSGDRLLQLFYWTVLMKWRISGLIGLLTFQTRNFPAMLTTACVSTSICHERGMPIYSPRFHWYSLAALDWNPRPRACESGHLYHTTTSAFMVASSRPISKECCHMRYCKLSCAGYCGRVDVGRRSRWSTSQRSGQQVQQRCAARLLRQTRSHDADDVITGRRRCDVTVCRRPRAAAVGAVSSAAGPGPDVSVVCRRAAAAAASDRHQPGVPPDRRDWAGACVRAVQDRRGTAPTGTESVVVVVVVWWELCRSYRVTSSFQPHFHHVDVCRVRGSAAPLAASRHATSLTTTPSSVVSDQSSSFAASVASRKRSSSCTDTPAASRDTHYWERRRKNNEAAKRSRDARRAKEEEVAVRASILEQENRQLRVELTAFRLEVARLSELLCRQVAAAQQPSSTPTTVAVSKSQTNSPRWLRSIQSTGSKCFLTQHLYGQPVNV